MSICSSGGTAVKAVALVAASFWFAVFVCCDQRSLRRTLAVLFPYGMVPKPISKMFCIKIYSVATFWKTLCGIWQWIQAGEETPPHTAMLRHSLITPFWGRRVVILIMCSPDCHPSVFLYVILLCALNQKQILDGGAVDLYLWIPTVLHFSSSSHWQCCAHNVFVIHFGWRYPQYLNRYIMHVETRVELNHGRYKVHCNTNLHSKNCMVEPSLSGRCSLNTISIVHSLGLFGGCFPRPDM